MDKKKSISTIKYIIFLTIYWLVFICKSVKILNISGPQDAMERSEVHSPTADLRPYTDPAS